MFTRLSGAEGNPRFDAATRSDRYRRRVADVVGVERRDVNRALET
jgi:endonuclease YncB( thermonuclease family)